MPEALSSGRPPARPSSTGPRLVSTGPRPAPTGARDVAAVAAALGRCRGHALTAGTMAVVIATAPGDDEEADEEMAFCVDAYRSTLAEALSSDVGKRLAQALADDVRRVEAFGAALPTTASGRGALDRAEAVALAWGARRDVLPALYRIMDWIAADEAERQDAAMRRMRTRTAELEAMFAEMEKVGRAIRLISLNAAVEASRAGGASGRAFGVIAAEVRALATQAAGLIARARHSLGGADGV